MILDHFSRRDTVMVLRTLMDEFLLAGQANGWSPLTVRQYERHLAWLAGWLEEHGATALEDVTRSLLRQWLAAQRERWSPATCKVAVTVLHSWLRFCFAEGYGGENLWTAVKTPKVPETVQRAVDRHEVEALLHVCEEPAASGLTPAQAEGARLRNAAIVAVLFDSILRASELCGLDVGDVYLDRLRLAVRRKGGKEQLVRFSERTADYLREWLLVRDGFAAPGEQALFTAITGNTPGCRLTTNGLRIVVKRLAERAGVAGLSPHAFRRGGTVQAIELGAPNRMVQLHGGWSKEAMVTVYSRTLVADERFDAYQPMRAVNGVKSTLAR
jgi:integrase/recombinase XerD